MPNLVCPKCSEARAARVSRRGFFETQLLGRLGYYPWECGGCRFRFTSKVRGEKPRKAKSVDDRSYHEPSAETMFGESRDDRPAFKADEA